MGKKNSNTLEDLNNHLFSQLDRLDDESLQGEKLTEEIDRAKAIGVIAKNITDNAKVVIEAEKFRDSKWDADAEVPKMLIGDESDGKKK